MQMVDVDKLSDAELRTKLLEFGFPVMPITGTTRKVMVKKLKLLLENKGKSAARDRRSLAKYSSEEESDQEPVKVKKTAVTRRATMAAAPMQPPATTRVSTRRTQAKLNDSDNESEVCLMLLSFDFQYKKGMIKLRLLLFYFCFDITYISK